MSAMEKLEIDLSQYESDTLPALRIIDPLDVQIEEELRGGTLTPVSLDEVVDEMESVLADEQRPKSPGIKLLVLSAIILLLGLKATNKTFAEITNVKTIAAKFSNLGADVKEIYQSSPVTTSKKIQEYMKARVLVNLRIEPAKGSTILGVLKPGEIVSYEGQIGKWAKVTRTVDDKTVRGFVHSLYLEPQTIKVTLNK